MHSQLPPSGADAWSQCPLWLTMNRLYPALDETPSAEGTAAHWAAWEWIGGSVIVEGQIAPNGVMLTSEMLDGADMLGDVVMQLLPESEFGPPHIEQPVAIGAIHTSCFGTPDVWAFNPHTVMLRIIDYKFGHRFVDEFENKQLIAYAAGIIEHLAKVRELNLDRLWQHIKIEFTIVQPRCYHRGAPVRTWRTTGAEIKPHVAALSQAAIRALNNPKIGTTGPACRDCNGRAHCPALQKAAYSDAEFSVKASPHELPPEAASLELRILETALDRLKARVDGLQAAVAAHAQAGHPTPHHALERTQGREQWTVDAATVLAIGSMYGIDLAKPAAPITPGQARKAGIDGTVITGYSQRQPGALKIVPANNTEARRVFGNPSNVE